MIDILFYAIAFLAGWVIRTSSIAGPIKVRIDEEIYAHAVKLEEQLDEERTALAKLSFEYAELAKEVSDE